MSLFSLIGISYLLYYLIYSLFIVTGDCDVKLRLATIFGKRKLGKFRGKVIWITGASSGIGEHIARVLARYGAKLVLTARNQAELERVKLACIEEGKLTPDDVLIMPMDITDLSKHKSAFDKVIQQFGQLDILINNAGRSQRAIWELIDIQVDRQLFDLNFFSVISLSKLAVKHFLERNEGHVVVTSSIAGVMGVPFSASYSGSKFALHGYFSSLLREKAGRNINITLLCPGPVFTNFLAASFTSKPGETFGQTHAAKDNRMSSERCAYLSAIAIANNVEEAWIAKFHVLLVTYVTVYFPTFSTWLYKRVGTRFVQKLRDNRVTVPDS